MMKKKKIKIWGKINLFETSAVGIASYPDAHLSANLFSLIKALSESSDQLNREIDDMEKQEEIQDEKAPEESEESPEAEEKKEESEAEEEKEESEKSKPITIDDIQKVVDGAVAKAIKGSETERGLVLTEDQVLKELETKSIGELAIMQGAFKPN